MSINSVSSASAAIISPRLNSAKITEDLFSKLDTKGKGYLEKSDLAAVFNSSNSTSSTTTANDIFAKLDSNSDGKVTKVEMKATLEKLAAQLDQPLKTRLQGGAPPPPPQNESQSSTSSSTTSVGAADVNGDGKISEAEASAYSEKTKTASDAKANTNTTSTPAPTDAETKLMGQMIELVKMIQAYTNPTDNTANATKNTALLTAS